MSIDLLEQKVNEVRSKLNLFVADNSNHMNIMNDLFAHRQNEQVKTTELSNTIQNNTDQSISKSIYSKLHNDCTEIVEKEKKVAYNVIGKINYLMFIINNYNYITSQYSNRVVMFETIGWFLKEISGHLDNETDFYEIKSQIYKSCINFIENNHELLNMFLDSSFISSIKSMQVVNDELNYTNIIPYQKTDGVWQYNSTNNNEIKKKNTEYLNAITTKLLEEDSEPFDWMANYSTFNEVDFHFNIVSNKTLLDKRISSNVNSSTGVNNLIDGLVKLKESIVKKNTESKDLDKMLGFIAAILEDQLVALDEFYALYKLQIIVVEYAQRMNNNIHTLKNRNRDMQLIESTNSNN